MSQLQLNAGDVIDFAIKLPTYQMCDCPYITIAGEGLQNQNIK